uniref:Uncharacterized protein n=1 Tax=Panagrolaimus superbus TaxID=310955 RepID=A0A914XY05_9BILA
MPRVRSLKGLLGLVVLLSLLGFSKGQWAQPRPLSDVVSNFNRRAFAAANYEAPVAAGLPNTTPNPYRPPDPQPRQEFPSQQQQQQQSNFYPFFNNNPPPQPPPLYNFNPITSYGGPQPQNNRYEAPAQRPETHYEAPLPTNYPSGVAYYQPNRGNPNNSKRPVLLISSYANGGGGSYDQPKGPFVPPNSQTNFNNNYPPPNPPSISPYENTRAPPTTEKPHQTLVPPADDTSYEENPYGEPENPETPKAPNSNYPGPSPPAPTPPSQPPQPTYPEEEGPPPQAPNPYETPSPPPSPEQPPAPQTPGIPPNIPSPPERPPTSPEIPSIPSQPHTRCS